MCFGLSGSNMEFVAGDLFITRSPLALNEWAMAEIRFLGKLMSFLKNAEYVDKPGSEAIRKYLDDYEDANGKLMGFENETVVEKEVDAITSNPLAIYRTIRRITNELAELKLHVEEFNMDMFQHFPPDKWLTNRDAEDAMMGILRVCHVYDFDLNSFSNGIIAGLETGVKLHAIHSFEIGRFAKEKEMFTLSIQFLEIALQKSGDASVGEGIVQAELQRSILLHDQIFDEPESLAAHYMFTQKITELKKNYGAAYKEHRKTQRTALVEEYRTIRHPNYNDITYWALCSQGSIQTEEEKAALFCWYGNEDPLFWIGPLKMELLASSPDILQIYDVIGEKQGSRLKEIASRTLSESLIIENAQEVESSFRTSVNSWVNDLKYPELRSLATTIEKVTGLKSTQETATEEFQVVSYSFTGHYDIHLDALGDDSSAEYKEKGDRLATFMYYLHEPTLGGSTAFPQSGVVAQPVQGSAVFWYNTYRDGTGYPMSHHGSCPVILGRKWIANKWIRYNDQFLTRKCGLDESDIFYIVSDTDEGE